MAGNPYLWSTTSATNSNADSDINLVEGQLPSTVNDSARGVMAGVAGWLKDTNGTLTTGGSANAQSVTSNVAYAALATGIRLVLKASFTNTAACTLNLTPAGGGAFGAKAVKVVNIGGEADPTAGQVSANGHYIFEYDAAANAAVGAWILLNPSNPAFTTGDVKPTFKSVADSGWVMMNDGSIGNLASGATTRANADTEALFTLLYNNIAALVVQNSSGTPVGRTTAAADFAASCRLVIPVVLGRTLAAAGAGSGLTSRALGATAGEESHALSIAELANHTHTDPGHGHSLPFTVGNYTGTQNVLVGADVSVNAASSSTSNTIASNTTGLASAGSGTAHNIMQPTSFLNVMIKL